MFNEEQEIALVNQVKENPKLTVAKLSRDPNLNPNNAAR